MTETKFIQRIHRRLPKEVYAVKFADRFTAGIPDCWYSGQSGDLWVEYKYFNGTSKPKLSALQLKWLDSRVEEGRNVAVICGSELGGIIYRNKEWYHLRYEGWEPVESIITWILNETNSVLFQQPNTPTIITVDAGLKRSRQHSASRTAGETTVLLPRTRVNR